VAAIAVAGMAVAFPVGIGLALVLGVAVNYISERHGNPVLLILGVLLVASAILVDASAYRRLAAGTGKVPARGLSLAVTGGLLMSLFYFFVQRSMSLNFSSPAEGKFTPYAAVFIFSTGILISNFIFNTWMMRRPVQGEPVSFRQYFSGTILTHLEGIMGGLIWCTGMSFSIIAAEKAGPAISYGLGQGATMVAAFWGVFIWKEFRNAPAGTLKYIYAMFILFISGLGLIVYAGI
jgi:glucose uptake protein